LYASRTRICEFLTDEMRSGHTVKQCETGFYWDQTDAIPDVMYVHPYADIDIKTSKGEYKFDDVFAPVFELIKVMDVFCKDKGALQRVKVLILMNNRVMPDGKTEKWSFHIHWP
jgi:hypothetical protein